jgi:hypothetical protein
MITNEIERENRLPLMLALASIGLLFSQVAYATNESSYKLGYVKGESNYTNCTFPEDKYGNIADCDKPSDACYNPLSHVDSTYGVMTNKTACIDGFVNGWSHVCQVGARDGASGDKVACPGDR